MTSTQTISLRQLLFDNKRNIAVGLILLIIEKSATLVIPSTGKYIIDDVIQEKDTEILKWIMLIIVLALITQSITSFLITHILGVRAQKKIVTIRTAFFNKLTHLDINYFSQNSSGEIASRTLHDFDSIRTLLGSGMVHLIGAALSIILTIGLMLYVNSTLTCYILPPLLLFGVIMYLFYKMQRPAFKKRKRIRAEVSSMLTEVFQGIKTVKGFNANQYTTGVVENSFLSLYQAIKNTLVATNLLISLSTFFTGMISLIVLWFGSQMVINKEMSIGELTTFILYLGFMVGPIYLITKIYNQVNDATASINRINEVFSLQNEPYNENAKEVILEGAIQFDHVNFKNDNKQILENISFSIQPNSINAFVGKSGSGKTTITELISGFIKPNTGTITIDGVRLDQLNLHSYRKQIGYVFEETFLFDASIRDNLLFVKPDATDDEIIEALDTANGLDFIDQLHDGIRTKIGKGGVNLSLGQKKRIAIARAVLIDPKILILDEPTANLDTQNANSIIESLSKLMANRTIILVTHQMSTLINTDQIILLEEGKVKEQGKHEDLIRQGGTYYNLNQPNLG